MPGRRDCAEGVDGASEAALCRTPSAQLSESGLKAVVVVGGWQCVVVLLWHRAPCPCTMNCRGIRSVSVSVSVDQVWKQSGFGFGSSDVCL